jgi:8-oxo-dGTP pyrophosphatase MutT (NUDIX family)
VGLRDGDGWVLCDCGRPHWGLYGAAGLLLVRRDLAEPHVLLQLRAAWTHGGGTWALPGGALDSHEDPVTAAAREAWEEAGIHPSRLEFVAIFSDDHGNWRYDTVIAHTVDDAGAHPANPESDEVRWVPLHEVAAYDLHPGLAASWPALQLHVATTLSPTAEP